MSWAFDAIKTLIQATADLAGGVMKLTLGATGDTMIYPTEPALRRTWDTGQAWEGFYLPAVLGNIGVFLDKFRVAWAYVSTNATTVTPTLDSGFGFSTTVTKNETSDTLTLTFSPSYDDAYVVCFASILNGPFIQRLISLSSSSITFEFYTDQGVLIDINDRSVMVLCVGQAAA
jgi:hypothetical protein